MKNHPRRPLSLTPKLFQEIKDTEEIQYLINRGRGEGAIIAKSKMMRSNELKAARAKKQPPIEKPKAKTKAKAKSTATATGASCMSTDPVYKKAYYAKYKASVALGYDHLKATDHAQRAGQRARNAHK